jgi:cytochrome c2
MIRQRTSYVILVGLLIIVGLGGCGTAPQKSPTALAATDKPATSVASEPTSTVNPTITKALPTLTPSSVPATATSSMGGMDMGGMDAPTVVAPKITGDPAKGKVIFNQGNGKGAPACITCHSAESDTALVGPSLANIGEHGPSHAAEYGQDVVTFLRESIVQPNAKIMEEPGHVYGANGISIMYQNYGKDLTEQEVNDLIAYLLTLKHEGDEHNDEHKD